MRDRPSRGFTLLELMTALAISSVLIVGVVGALIGLGRESAVRELVSAAQEEARSGLSALAREVRAASLCAPSGVLVLADAEGNPTTRPTVQIYDGVAGGGLLDAKPDTDALLVVQALSAPRAAAIGDHLDSSQPFAVTDDDQFHRGDHVVFGEYVDAGWATVTDVDLDEHLLTVRPTLASTSTANLFPGQAKKLASGSLVRLAQARLYYVNTRDELVRMELSRPVPPASAAELGESTVLATSFENLQIDCTLDSNGALGACGAGVASPDPLAEDATAALGTARARIALADVAGLRTLQLGSVVHGKHPLRVGNGDGPIALDGHDLAAAGQNVRRAYRLELAIRNTSLEAL
jgi:prepilin-type N-terminal cleavage/methylation domain-containing protein